MVFVNIIYLNGVLRMSSLIYAISLLMAVHFLFLQVVAQEKEEASSGQKRKCFQCNMPYECSSGLCFGDYCIKSLASDQYVSKGCENKTFRSVNGESYYLDESPEKVEKSQCVTEFMFGIENTICYCNDADFCNRSPRTLCTFVVPLVPILMLNLIF